MGAKWSQWESNFMNAPILINYENVERSTQRSKIKFKIFVGQLTFKTLQACIVIYIVTPPYQLASFRVGVVQSGCAPLQVWLASNEWSTAERGVACL